MTDSLGARVFAVREALGTRRRPMSQDAFAALLTEQSGGKAYYGSDFSNVERNKKALTLEDVALIASVDPERRGKYWLAWGDEEDETRLPLPTPSLDEIQPDPGETDIGAFIDAKPARKGKGKAG